MRTAILDRPIPASSPSIRATRRAGADERGRRDRAPHPPRPAARPQRAARRHHRAWNRSPIQRPACWPRSTRTHLIMRAANGWRAVQRAAASVQRRHPPPPIRYFAGCWIRHRPAPSPAPTRRATAVERPGGAVRTRLHHVPTIGRHLIAALRRGRTPTRCSALPATSPPGPACHRLPRRPPPRRPHPRRATRTPPIHDPHRRCRHRDPERPPPSHLQRASYDPFAPSP